MPFPTSLSLRDRLWGKLPNRPHLVNKAAIMVGARVVGMGFGFIGSAWAARCMEPHNYGISGMVQSVVAQASILLSALHPTILIRAFKNASNGPDRDRLVQSYTLFKILSSVLLSLAAIAVMASSWVPADYHFAGWFFIPLVVIINLQPTWLFQASEHQHFQSSITIFQPAFTALLYFIFFRPGMRAGADLAVVSTCSFLLLVILWTAMKRLGVFKGNLLVLIPWSEIAGLIRQSGWLFISGLAVYIYTMLELPLVGWLYSIDALGQYRTAFQVVNAAQNFFWIVPTILYPRFLEWRKRGEVFLWQRQVKLALFFSVFGLAAGVAAWVIIPALYPLVFGQAFTAAAKPCAVLVASKLIMIVEGIYYWGLMTDHRYDKTVSLLMIATALFSLTANLILIPSFGMRGASWVNVASELWILAGCWFFSYRRIQRIQKGDLAA